MPSAIQDWNALEQRYPQPTLLKQILDSFLNHHRNSVETLQHLIDTADYPALVNHVHQLKGAAQIMQVPVVATIAARIEGCLKQDNQPAAGDFEFFKVMLTQWLAEISEKRDRL